MEAPILRIKRSWKPERRFFEARYQTLPRPGGGCPAVELVKEWYATIAWHYLAVYGNTELQGDDGQRARLLQT